MATNIAEIGFAADSSQLKSAKAALDGIVPSAKSADRAANELTGSMGAVASAAAGVITASRAAAAAMGVQENAATRAAAAQGMLGSAATVTESAAVSLARNNAKVVASLSAEAAASEIVAEALQKQMTKTQALAAVEELWKNQRNVVNQLLGRQSAMNAAVAATEKATAATAAATSATNAQASAQQRLNAMNAAAVAPVQNLNLNTANLAAQFQDIAVTAAMGMNPLMIALQQGTQVSAIFAQQGATAAGTWALLGQAVKSVISPIALATIGIIGLVAGLVQLVPWGKTAAFALRAMASGIDAAKQALLAATPLVLGLAAAFALWKLPVIISGVAALTSAIFGLVTAQVAALATNPFTAIPLAIGLAIAAIAYFRKEIANALGNEFIQGMKRVGNLLISILAAPVNAVIALVKNIPELGKALINEVTKTAVDIVNTVIKIANLARPYLPWFLGGGEPIATVDVSKFLLPVKSGLVGAVGDVSKAVADTFKTDWIGNAVDLTGKGIDKLTKKFREWADALTPMDPKLKKIIENVKSQIGLAKIEQDSIGMTAERASILREQMELLNKAREEGLKLTPKQVKDLMQYGELLGRLKSDTEKLREAFDFTRDVVRGFVTDLRDGLKNGEGFLKSFLNAVTNILDKVSNKLIDLALDMAMKSDQGGAYGGILGGLVKFFGPLVGLTGDAAATGATNPSASSGVSGKFAKGGVFTNGIYSSPTLFSFASGGKFGEMGEAGPEAVMPLRRGPDGSLGVQMHGGNDNGGPSVVVIVENNAPNTTVREERSQGPDGREMRRIIIDQVRQAMASGELDASMRARYGNNPTRITRG